MAVDSFIPHYINGGGQFQTKELEPLGTFAGTDVRISEEVKNSMDFRSGVIYHAYNLYPNTIPTVDIAPLNSDGSKVLLCKKYDEDKWRFIGGFVHTTDSSLELTAKRIFSKKIGNAESGDYQYIGSCQISDWRFRGEEDKIMTSFFTCRVLWGSISPIDVEVKYFSISDLKEDIFMDEHKPLLKLFQSKIKNN